MKLPLYLTIQQVADILGWSYLKTWRWLTKSKALVKHGGKLVTTIPSLRAAFPDTFDLVFEEIAERLDSE